MKYFDLTSMIYLSSFTNFYGEAGWYLVDHPTNFYYNHITPSVNQYTAGYITMIHYRDLLIVGYSEYKSR